MDSKTWHNMVMHNVRSFPGLPSALVGVMYIRQQSTAEDCYNKLALLSESIATKFLWQGRLRYEEST